MAGVSTSKRLQDNTGSPPNRRATGGDAAPPRQRTAANISDANPVYESPVKRVKRAVGRASNKRIIETVGELKTFIDAEDPLGRGVPAGAVAGIALRMRVAFISFDTCSTGPVTRLHLVDKCTDESVEEMHKVVRDDYARNKSIVDSELATASLYGVDDAAAGLPEDGAVVLVSRMWSLKLFSKQACQLTTSLECIKSEQ